LVAHEISQAPAAVQIAEPFEAGAGQAAQRVPQVATSVFETQKPLQLWVAPMHAMPQALFCATQAPLQIFCPLGQAGTQLTPLQATLPPVGATQGLVHDVPQVASALLLTHLPLQR
jgi:hypothetical protein